eukprot:g45445.t1
MSWIESEKEEVLTKVSSILKKWKGIFSNHTINSIDCTANVAFGFIPNSPSIGENMTATTYSNNVEKLSNAKEERKLRKPLIERKRRERINNCLDQLKETVVGAFRLDADILEMTVKHLQNVQNSRMIADTNIGLEAQQRYSAGYIQCMHEVHNLLLTCDWMDKTVGARLLNHLLKSLPRSSEDSRQARLKNPPVNLQTAQTPLSP